MATREAERRFVAATYGKEDPGFYAANCGSCHMTSCLTCHGARGHAIGKPAKYACINCHRGYFTGADYYGKAPREEHQRYQRGERLNDEPYLKMLPDIHAELGMTCGACHTMASLASGRKAAKVCIDCHTASQKVLEHAIPAHLAKLECYACHSAWAPQEYGTFFLRFDNSPVQEEFDLRENSGAYVKSVFLKRQDAPPLGINSQGKVSPIRPEFIAYFSAIRDNRPVGRENRLLAAQWRAFFPHTVRRGTVVCEGCHDNPARFLLERQDQRIYRLRDDGLSLDSFWDRTGQTMANGSFMPSEQVRDLAVKSPAYRKAYLQKWKNISGHADNSSAGSQP
jgi:hypothetical protein